MCDQPRQHIKKQRHYLPAKVRRVKAVVFPVVMYVCESWTVKKAEHRRTDAFELWCWRRLLRVQKHIFPLNAHATDYKGNGLECEHITY